jgi:hypothetical protein
MARTQLGTANRLTAAASPEKRYRQQGGSHARDIRPDRHRNAERRTAGGALYDLAAQQIANQAFVVACMTRSKISKAAAAQLVEDVAGYPGVTGRTTSKGNTVGERATDVLMVLAASVGRVRPGRLARASNASSADRSKAAYP